MGGTSDNLLHDRALSAGNPFATAAIVSDHRMSLAVANRKY